VREKRQCVEEEWSRIMDRRQISIVVIPSNHADIIRNVQVSYPWFPNLKAKCFYVGREKEVNGEWCTSSF